MTLRFAPLAFHSGENQLFKVLQNWGDLGGKCNGSHPAQMSGLIDFSDRYPTPEADF
jgi:hypothetical protein